MADAGVVDKNIEAAEVLADCFEQIGDALLIADIAGVNQNSDALAGEFFLNECKAQGVASAEDKITALFRQSMGDRKTDALGCAGDKREFSLQRQDTDFNRKTP